MSDWRLVYETNGSGSVISGSLDRLSTAVRRAGDIKVMYTTGNDNWWSRYCASVNVRGLGRSAAVTATYMEAADTRSVPEGLDFENPFAVEYHIYNSSGHRNVVKVDPATGRPIDTIAGLLPMRWYAKDYRMTFWEWVSSAFGS